jgi:uncharacterized protein YccT (UPF0319 family)
MEISAIGKAGIQSSPSSQSEIKTLENKKQRLQEQIDKINQEKSGNSSDKEKQVQLLEAQIQLIDTQLQQLKQKQQQAKDGGTAKALTEAKNSAVAGAAVQPGIDVEA